MTKEPLESPGAIRHVLSLSGGKDSTALAIYMRERVPEIEYVFCDTAKELPETYEYLANVGSYLGRGLEAIKVKELSTYSRTDLLSIARTSIVMLRNDDEEFDRLLKIRGGYLPSPRMRWCTEHLKIKPFEQYVGDDPMVNYIGIRADENRKGYISHKRNIEARYPFIEDGIRKDDVECILRESGLGMPPYYSWRSRSGCFFCFFQQRIEWVGLLEEHPNLYHEAMAYEKRDPVTGGRYTWVEREGLRELMEPERVTRIREEHARRMAEASRWRAKQPLAALWDDEDDSGERACLICEL